MSEAFQPISVKPARDNRFLFAVRCVFDLQLLTIHRFLRRELAACQGLVLDVGAGQAPWRELLDHAQYTGLDIESSQTFGMQRTPGIVYYDGGRMPFADGSFDHLLCAEVLEHVPDAETFANELARVLRSGGSLVLTLPWSARLHHLPHDYRRLTRYGLQLLFERAGFLALRIEERGNDVAAVANKMIVMAIRLLRPARPINGIWTWPLCLLLAPLACAFVIAAHLSMQLGLGSREDPLGYGLVAIRR